MRRTEKGLDLGESKDRTVTAAGVGVGKRATKVLPVLGGPQTRAERGALRRPPVVSFVSLGCVKNLVDSEIMLGRLAESGAVISGDEAVADTVVVNTCGFLEASRSEALDILRDLAARKRSGNLKRIVVAGCLVQRDGEAIRRAVPEVDALVGVNNREDVVRTVWRMDRDGAVDRYLGGYHGQPWTDRGRLRLTPRHYAYLRISEGCNQKCTFCTIPSIRGPMHSKTPDQIIAEARELIADGVKEIVLIGQDTTSYGQDIGYGPGLAGLLRRLDRGCDGVEWIRLMYVYPSVLTDEIIDAIAACERIVKYIDIPLQHVDDRILRRMHRRVARKQQERLLSKLRERIPGVAIRTTFIVGFPGETEAQFEELCRFVRDFGFDAAGAFTYSLEAETPAGRMQAQLPDRVKQERYERLMQVQQDVAFERARERVGSGFSVLVDGLGAHGRAVARHAGQAPEVDSVCLLNATGPSPGTFARAECIGAEGYDLLIRTESPPGAQR